MNQEEITHLFLKRTLEAKRTPAESRMICWKHIQPGDVQRKMQTLLPSVWFVLKDTYQCGRQKIAMHIGEVWLNHPRYLTETVLKIRVGARILDFLITQDLVKYHKLNGEDHEMWICEITPKQERVWKGIKFDRDTNANKTKPKKAPAVWMKEPSDNFLHQKERRLEMRTKVGYYAMDLINKQQQQPWRINKDILKVQRYYLDNLLHEKVFSFQKETPKTRYQRESIASKQREVTTCIERAKEFKKGVFYHEYFIDSRGRFYPATYSLSESASDSAKGLLSFGNTLKAPLGSDGLAWLSHALCNNYGEDKTSIHHRRDFIANNKDMILECANDPYRETAWQKADKQWAFLSQCMEYNRLHKWCKKGNSLENFSCRIPVFIDGTCNGIQHIAALTRDREMAQAVNIDNNPGEVPNDLYTRVAEAIWLTIGKVKLTSAQYRAYKKILEVFSDPDCTWEDERAILQQYEEYSEVLWRYYWSTIKDKSIRRKLIKRPVMTLGYGVTRNGVGNQIQKDSPSILKDLPESHSICPFDWLRRFGELVSEYLFDQMSGLNTLRNTLEEICVEANKRGEYLSWEVPIVDLQVKHTYTIPFSTSKGKKSNMNRRLEIKMQGRISKWHYQDFYDKDARLNTAKQKNAFTPNFVHSLDAAHLNLVGVTAKFPTVFNHDSFGCLPGHMTDLQRIVQQKFIELHLSDPFQHLCDQFGKQIPPRGNYNPIEIMHNPFAFA